MTNDSMTHHIRSNASNIRENLSNISKRSEGDFLKLGNTLKQSSAIGMELTTKASDFVALTEGDSGKKALIDVKRLIHASLNGLVESRKSIVSKCDSVNTVIGRLVELHSKNDDIEMIAKYLRAVALNIFIETARSRMASENFSIIANEIKQLSGTILGLSKTIRDTVVESRNRFLTLNQDICHGVEQLRNLTDDADKSVQNAVSKADDMVTQAAGIAAHTGDMGGVIFNQVGKIVMGLQFHDSMRQRLEHIEKGLSDMEEICSRNTSSQDTGDMGLLNAISSVLAEQLQQIIIETHAAHEQNDKAFDLIDQIIFLLGMDINQLVGGNNGKTNNAVLRSDSAPLLTDSLTEFVGLNDQGGNLVVRIDEAYTMASDTAASLSEQIEKIHEISLDAHIKSVNAIIAAMNLGNEGKTLTVLAGEMKNLSELADIFVRDVGQIIMAIVSGTNEIASDVHAISENSEKNKREMTDVVTAIPKKFGKIKRKAEELNQIIESLHSIHSSAKQELAFMITLADELNAQYLLLEEIRAGLTPFKGSESDMQKAHSLMGERYTMEKERMLLNKKDGSADKPNTGRKDQDLGDNVELF